MWRTSRRFNRIWYLLVMFVVAWSVPLLILPVGAQIPEANLLITTISGVRIVDGETILSITIRQPIHPEWAVFPDYVEVEVDGESRMIQLVWWEVNITLSQDQFLQIVNTTDPYSNMEYPLTFADFYEKAPVNSMTMQYNLGEVAQPPMVRARPHEFWPQGAGPGELPAKAVNERWCPWSDPVEAVPPNPIPVVEIATVIGVGGIAIAVLNNFWSGRREKQMTEVTRSAAEDDRFMALYDASRDVAFQETLSEVLYQYKWTDYEDFLSKYGPETNVHAWAKIQSVAQYFEGIGVLVEEQSVDVGRVHRLLSTQIVRCWEKLEPIIMEQRKRELDPHIYNSFESLYYAIKKYQQQGPPVKEDMPIHRFED